MSYIQTHIQGLLNLAQKDPLDCRDPSAPEEARLDLQVIYDLLFASEHRQRVYRELIREQWNEFADREYPHFANNRLPLHRNS